MAEAQNKTVATNADVAAYVAALEPERRREEASALVALYERITGEPAKMWGPSIIGFGEYHYRYDSGRSGTMCRSGFAPRKGKHVLYGMARPEDPAAAGEHEARLARLGKHKLEGGCLNIARLDQVDLGVLEELIADRLAEMNRLYPPA